MVTSLMIIRSHCISQTQLDTQNTTRSSALFFLLTYILEFLWLCPLPLSSWHQISSIKLIIYTNVFPENENNRVNK